MHWTKAKLFGLRDENLEVLTECADKNWDLDVNQLKEIRTQKEKRAMTQILKYVYGRT